MDVAQIATVVGILGGIVVIGGGLLGLVAYAFLRRFDHERDLKQSEVFELTKEELDLYRLRAERVPALEQKIEVLREEVGAAKAIASLDGKLSNELARINERIAASDERTSRADAWQAASNKALLDGVNALLGANHLSSTRMAICSSAPRTTPSTTCRSVRTASSCSPTIKERDK